MVACGRVQKVNGCKVLAGIVTRNRAKALRKAINSALKQKASSVEIVVIDDASTDETITLTREFPRVTWIRRELTGGYISARNELMTRDNSDYFVSLDDDAWFVSDDEIAAAVEFLQQNSSTAAVAFDILSPDRPQSRERSAPQPTANFIGCGHVLRMSAVREVGGYEPTPGNYGGEEKDLSLRLMDAGYQIVRLPGVHVWHDKTSVARAVADQYRSGVCNDLVLTFRRTPAALLPVALIVKCYQHFSFALRKGLFRPCLEGLRLFFDHLSETRRTRRPVKLSTLRRYMRLARKT